MINFQTNNAMQIAIAEDYDRLCWSPVPVAELCANDDPIFTTESN